MPLFERSELELTYAPRALKRATPPEFMLFPISYSHYRFLIQRAEAALGLQAHFTPHSPRAGWASDSAAEGLAPVLAHVRHEWPRYVVLSGLLAHYGCPRGAR